MLVIITKFVETDSIRFRLQHKFESSLPVPYHAGMILSGFMVKPLDLIIDKVVLQRDRPLAGHPDYHTDPQLTLHLLCQSVTLSGMDDLAVNNYIMDAYGASWSVDRVYLTADALTQSFLTQSLERT